MKKVLSLALCLFASACLIAQTQVKVGEDLQAAINTASAGSTVLVQAGTFTGNFTMKEGVNVSGGWDETFSTQTPYGTILDANKSGRVVEQTSRFSTLTEWSGLTIQHGNGGDGAGAVLREGGRLYRCKITENEGVDGGGICYDDGTPATVALEECIVSYNKGRRAGGMWCKATVKNTLFEYNETSAGGAGVVLNPGRLISCVVRYNKATEDFGGVRACSGSYPDQSQVINCLIYGNEAREVGGLSIDDNMGDVIGCTIVGNNHHHSNPESGVNINRNYSSNKECVFYNNVIWGNMQDGVVADQQINDNVLCYEHFSNNAIATKLPEGLTALVLNADNAAVDGPQFVDPKEEDFSLMLTSSLIDKGLTEQATVTTDIAGNARIVGAAVDIGAYELQDSKVLVGGDLQAAINTAPAGSTVYVQAGTFTGNFTMKEGVNVSGGWDENFTSQTEFATILDANNSGRVVEQNSRFSSLTEWSNLTIQHGNSGDGAGALIREGGRFYMCKFFENQGGDGGAVCYDDGSMATVALENCIVSHNKGRRGAGMWCKATVINTVFEYNEASAGGGGVLTNPGRLINCIVRFNKANEDFGGVRACSGSYPDQSQIINCLIYGNEGREVGGLSIDDNMGDVIGNTIVCNNHHHGNPESGVNINRNYSSNKECIFANNVIWGNMKDGVVEAQQINDNVLCYENFFNNAIATKVPEGIAAIILNADNAAADGPQFVDPVNGDFRISFASPLLDAGDDAKSVVDNDLMNAPRVMGNKVDIGAYELPWYILNITLGEAVITVGDMIIPAGEMPVPEGLTVGATITPNEGFKIKAVTFNDEELVPADDIYTLPPVMADAVLVVETEEDKQDGLDENKIGTHAYKFIKNGNIYISKDGKIYNLLGTEMR